MIATKSTLGQILEKAIQKEIDSQNLYIMLSHCISEPPAKAALKELARYEKEHQQFLEKYVQGGLKVGILGSAQPIDYHIAEYLEQPEISPDMSLKGIFLLAANREKASHQFYLGLAGAHPKGEVRSMMEKLAAQELGHKQKVETLYTEVAFPQTDGG
jgi:rubrerythrin